MFCSGFKTALCQVLKCLCLLAPQEEEEIYFYVFWNKKSDNFYKNRQPKALARIAQLVKMSSQYTKVAGFGLWSGHIQEEASDTYST